MEGGQGRGEGEEGASISDPPSCQDLACGQVEQKLRECQWLNQAPLISGLEAGHSVSLSLQPVFSQGPGSGASVPVLSGSQLNELDSEPGAWTDHSVSPLR